MTDVSYHTARKPNKSQSMNKVDTYHSRRNNQYQIKLPSNLVQRHGRCDKCDLTCKVKRRQAQGDASGSQVVGENFRHINILCCVNEETPPHNVEPDEENCCSKAGLIVRVEERSCQCAKEDDGHYTATRTDEHKSSSAESIDIQCRPSVSDKGESRPACVEKKRDVSS